MTNITEEVRLSAEDSLVIATIPKDRFGSGVGGRSINYATLPRYNLSAAQEAFWTAFRKERPPQTTVNRDSATEDDYKTPLFTDIQRFKQFCQSYGETNSIHVEPMIFAPASFTVNNVPFEFPTDVRSIEDLECYSPEKKVPGLGKITRVYVKKPSTSAATNLHAPSAS